jgi:hypothetical protein
MSTKRGWSSKGLKVISSDDPDYWSTADASRLLGPPELSHAQVRQLVNLAGLEPAGKKRVTLSGRGGRHVRVYKASDLIKAFGAIADILS